MLRNLSTSISIFAVLALPMAALAHETQQFKIGDKEYSIVVGTLNEPTVVDDKAGVALIVTQLGVPSTAAVHDDGDGDAASGAPVEGLDKLLKVEVSAGDKKKVFELTPQWGTPGSYEAVFFPTVQTTLTYRFFGRINNVPVDFSFSCNPAGHPQVADEKVAVEVSKNVTRTLKRGAFGCPLGKADLGFPEPAVAMVDLAKNGETTPDVGMIGLIVGCIALLVGIGAWVKAGAQ